MERVVPAGTTDILQLLHGTLDVHFKALKERRSALEPASPVFALEHGLDADDLALLKGAVREAVRTGFTNRSRKWWLPFVVYAAEVGYEYLGDEYWHTFAATTPGWADYDGDRRQTSKRSSCVSLINTEALARAALGRSISASSAGPSRTPSYPVICSDTSRS